MRPPLNRLPAAQLLRMIGVSRSELEDGGTHSFVDAVDQREGEVHAFTWFEPERALNVARGFDVAPEAVWPMGLPVAVKDVIDTAGIAYRTRIRRSTLGALPGCRRALHRGDGSEAGGYVFGKTVTAELANFAPGPTRNPSGQNTHREARRADPQRPSPRIWRRGARYSNGRFGDSAGGILRSRWVRADARPCSACWRAAAVRYA